MSWSGVGDPHPGFGEPYPESLSKRESLKRKRGGMSTSDEIIEGEMDPKNNRYRVGWPILPPLPVVTVGEEKASAEIPNYSRILMEVRDMLQTHRIGFSQPFFAYRAPDDRRNDLDDIHLTLVIPADMIHDRHKVEIAVIRLRSWLKNEKELECCIEFIQETVVFGLITYPIHHTAHNLRSRWDGLADAITQALHPNDWLGMEFLHRGLIGNIIQCPPTVVVTSATITTPEKYKSVFATVRNVVKEENPAWEAEVLFKSSIFHNGGSVVHSNTVNAKDYDTIRMGCSIGFAAEPKGESRGSGTIGGVIKLKSGEKEMLCGLTNFHVVRNQRIDDIMRTSKDKTLYPNNPTLAAFPHRFLSPSQKDHEEFCQNTRNAISIWSKRDPTDPVTVENKQRQQSLLSRYQQFDRQLGSLSAGSGFRSVPGVVYNTNENGKRKKGEPGKYNFGLDWALLALDSGKRSAENRLRETHPSMFGKSGLMEGMKCNEWSTFDISKVEIKTSKRGRTTGWTTGKLNSLFARINITQCGKMAAKFDFTDDRPGAAFTVVSGTRNIPFVDSGDSGSILLHDTSGTWLGLLFGTLSEKTALMMPIDLVLRDIERVTGAKVVEPSWTQPDKVGLAPWQTFDE